MRTLLIAGSVLSAAMATTHTQADILFDNFGPADTYSLEYGWTMSYGGPLGGIVYEHATPFTVTGGDYYLDAADVAVLHNWGPDLVLADIHADDAGAPGAVLESTTGSGVTPPFVHAPPIELAFSGSLLLENGHTYWLSLRTPQEDALMSWAFNSIGQYGTYAQRVDGGPWQSYDGIPGEDSYQAVYRISGTAVPAPGALALLALASLSRRRRRV